MSSVIVLPFFLLLCSNVKLMYTLLTVSRSIFPGMLHCHYLTKAVYMSSIYLCQKVHNMLKPKKTVENVYGSFQTAQKKWSNSRSEKSPLDLKNNSANQSIQTRNSYENFQTSTTDLCCLHVWMLQQAACRSTFTHSLTLFTSSII